LDEDDFILPSAGDSDVDDLVEDEYEEDDDYDEDDE
jgi:DNA-directed RNA polymerase subunit beta'